MPPTSSVASTEMVWPRAHVGRLQRRHAAHLEGDGTGAGRQAAQHIHLVDVGHRRLNTLSDGDWTETVAPGSVAPSSDVTRPVSTLVWTPCAHAPVALHADEQRDGKAR